MKALMGKRKRDSGMEKNRALKEKFEELEQHKYWNYSDNLRLLKFISRSPRELMSSLQTNRVAGSLSDEERDLFSSNACSVCSDCLEDEESDEEEVRSVVESSASVRGDASDNEDVDDGINKFNEKDKEVGINKGPGEMIRSTGTDVQNAEKIGYMSSASVHEDTSYDENDKIYEEEKEVEINKGSGEMIPSTSTDVKITEKIRYVGWGFSVLITVFVLIGLVIGVMLSIHVAWYVDQDLDQVFIPPT